MSGVFQSASVYSPQFFACKRDSNVILRIEMLAEIEELFREMNVLMSNVVNIFL